MPRTAQTPSGPPVLAGYVYPHRKDLTPSSSYMDDRFPTDGFIGHNQRHTPSTTVARLRTCPMVTQSKAMNPNCPSGFRVNSTQNRNTPYKMQNIASICPSRNLAHLRADQRQPSRIGPANRASYSCDGCRGYTSPGNTTAHGPLLTRPMSSALTKFAARTQHRPIGATSAKPSARFLKATCLAWDQTSVTINVPARPP